MTKITREDYLYKAMIMLNERVFTPSGFPIDIKKTNVSCSLVSGGSASQKKRLGQCWARSASTGGNSEIQISTTVDDSFIAVDTLAHELVHAVDNCQSGHGKGFRNIALAIGLNGSTKMTQACAGEELTVDINAIIEELGEYPHQAMNFNGRKKQTTRNKKIYCRSCGWSFRASQSNIDKMLEHDHAPNCLACDGGTLEAI